MRGTPRCDSQGNLKIAKIADRALGDFVRVLLETVGAVEQHGIDGRGTETLDEHAMHPRHRRGGLAGAPEGKESWAGRHDAITPSSPSGSGVDELTCHIGGVGTHSLP